MTTANENTNINATEVKPKSPRYGRKDLAKARRYFEFLRECLEKVAAGEIMDASSVDAARIADPSAAFASLDKSCAQGYENALSYYPTALHYVYAIAAAYFVGKFTCIDIFDAYLLLLCAEQKGSTEAKALLQEKLSYESVPNLLASGFTLVSYARLCVYLDNKSVAKEVATILVPDDGYGACTEVNTYLANCMRLTGEHSEQLRTIVSSNELYCGLFAQSMHSGNNYTEARLGMALLAKAYNAGYASAKAMVEDATDPYHMYLIGYGTVYGGLFTELDGDKAIGYLLAARDVLLTGKEKTFKWEAKNPFFGQTIRSYPCKYPCFPDFTVDMLNMALARIIRIKQSVILTRYLDDGIVEKLINDEKLQALTKLDDAVKYLKDNYPPLPYHAYLKGDYWICDGFSIGVEFNGDLLDDAAIYEPVDRNAFICYVPNLHYMYCPVPSFVVWRNEE